MSTLQAFKRALVDMKNAGELEKILEAARGYKEDTLKVKHDIEYINQIAELGVDNVSVIPVIMELQSIAIFKSALFYMVKYDKELRSC